ncbi:G-type lectin S-receptor-like serine/threonine-protein kinase RLK1 [Amborella trichopoda]|nr:G-type lectin S-receptor-like serine/threonine-protein kinase RLK1 [Amborella trichopoda]|eukprot:XP_006854585.3 G-type lectin S-receptor-like serine/threonine-protein kinase RLK1 [Amborella trichopoda]
MVSSMATFRLHLSFLLPLLLITSPSSAQSFALQNTSMASPTQILAMPFPSTYPFRNISLGSFLSTTPTGSNQSYWLCPSGNFAFGFYPLSKPQNFMVGVWMPRTPENTLIWTANRDDPPLLDGTSIILTSNGKLLVRNQGIQERPITNNSISATSAAFFDDGNFVLYSDTKVIWQSFDIPTDTIMSGQRLLNGYEILSSSSDTTFSSGKFRLKMQDDGNLVLYPMNTTDRGYNSYWSTATYGRGNSLTLNLNSDGHLYLMNSSGYFVKNITESKDSSFIYRMTLSSEGKLELYSHGLEKNGSLNSSVIWSAVEGSCDVKGICGDNSYCILKALKKPSCRCAPGFSAPGPERTFLDCARSFKDWECEDRKYNFTIDTIEKVIWQDPEYTDDIVTEDDCKETCLDDCTCMAAFFDYQKCAIMKSPLRYGKRTSNSVKAFFRVPHNVTTTGSSNISPPHLSRNPTGSVIERGLHGSFNKWFPISLALGSGLVLSLALSGFLAYRSRMGWYYRLSSNHSLKNQVNLISFAYGQLYEATRGFAEALGKGSFGTVFKGILCNDAEVAVKKLEKLEEEGEEEFRTEVNVIGRTHHKNLVQLLGFCDEGSHRLLVYEFMRNGSLAELLFNEENRPNWEDRVKMALDIARGLLYLHEECVTQIIHCDIKPQNILLDEFHTAKISDFGLAKLLTPDQTRTLTVARGTRGYEAPEWHRNVPVTAKVDVYSYGAMLMEIICCRKSLVVDVPEDEIILSEWVYKCFQDGCLEKLITPEELEVREEKQRLERMVLVALWCKQEEPTLRPSMKTVVLMLEGTVEVQVPPHPCPHSAQSMIS